MVVGSVESPYGTQVNGFKVTTNWGGNGPIFDPSTQIRTYDDIERIMGKNEKSLKTHEEITASGKFKSYFVATG